MLCSTMPFPTPAPRLLSHPIFLPDVPQDLSLHPPHFFPPQTAAPILALETSALPSSSPNCHGCLWQHPHPFFPWSLGRGERWGFFGIRKRLRRRTATCADRQTDGCFALPEPTLLPPLPAGPDCRGLACNKLLPDLAPGGKAAARAPASSPWEGICLRHRS